MSGSMLTRKPIPLMVGDTAYDAALNILGIHSKDPQERLKALNDVPSSEIISKISFQLPIMPVIDEDLIKVEPTFTDFESSADVAKLLPGRKWCKELMAGDCQMDVSHLYAKTQGGCYVHKSITRVYLETDFNNRQAFSTTLWDHEPTSAKPL